MAGTNNKLNTLCQEVALSVSEFINCELSESEMERFSAHIDSCPTCSRFVEEEREFETALSGATTEETVLQNFDNSKINDLSNNVLKAINYVPQVKEKTPLEEMESSNPIITTSHASFWDSISSVLTKRNLAALTSMFLVVFVTLWAFEYFPNFGSQTPSISNQAREFSISLHKFKDKRAISTLYGYSHTGKNNAYIRSIAENIKGYEGSIRETIIHKIKKLKISRRRNPKRNKMGKLSHRGK